MDKKQGGVVGNVRWIEPEVWGFSAWSTLFWLARSMTSTNLSTWFALVRQLPEVLPCPSCRKCCAKFIRQTPPEQNPIILEWLLSLRSNVMIRNRSHVDCNPIEKELPLPSAKETLERFEMRERSSLWRVDLFFFLNCVAMTLDHVTNTWTQFMQTIFKLAPVDLQLQPPHKPFTDVADVIQWLTRSPLCPTAPLLAMLSTVTIQSRLSPLKSEQK